MSKNDDNNDLDFKTLLRESRLTNKVGKLEEQSLRNQLKNKVIKTTCADQIKDFAQCMETNGFLGVIR
jgi:hypothetical protein